MFINNFNKHFYFYR